MTNWLLKFSGFESGYYIKQDLSGVLASIKCWIIGHEYDTDENGYLCQKCVWSVDTDIVYDSYEQAYAARPHKRFWGQRI